MEKHATKRTSLKNTLRVCIGFAIVTCLLLLLGRIELFDAAFLLGVGGIVSFLMIQDEMRVIRALHRYFQQRMTQDNTDHAPAFQQLQSMNDGSPLDELGWLVSVVEKERLDKINALSVENNYLKNTIGNLPFPLIILDRRGYVLEFNHRAKEVFKPLASNKPISFFIFDSEIIKRIESVGRSQNAFEEVEFIHRENKNQIFDLLISQFFADNHAQTALILIDRSEAKEAEQMRVDFVANVSHELRTPLTSVLGFVETLKGPAGKDPDTRDKFLSIVENQASRMIRLVADQLSLSSIERIEAIQPQSHHDLNIIAERVCEILAGVARKQGCSIQLQHPEHDVMIIAEYDEIIQMIQNLTENAIRYGAQSGQVRIIITADTTYASSASKNRYACVSIEDDGDGIAPEHLPRLTERFYRIDKDRSRSKGGTGLGLAIVKHIVNRHRGHLHISSELGEGSQFTVYLPQPQKSAHVTKMS